ncbi:hypothetical protein [Spirillospora sp. CA-294931]|uniref:hypothetical protein n=1 Tax=Spirillospora sp. CA-294931 TaxID=3240042 RepID=UPI003D8F15D6
MGIRVHRLAAAALGLATGLTLMGAADAAAKPKDKVGICHRTASNSKPYVFIVVDRNSAKYKGHLAHRNNPSKWKNGRRDYIDGLDGKIRSLKDCPNKGKPVPMPPKPIPPGELGPGQKPPKGVCRTQSLERTC